MEIKSIKSKIEEIKSKKIWSVTKSIKFSKIIHNKILIEKYINEDKSTREVAKELNVSPCYIQKRLKILNILRNKIDGRKGKHSSQWKGDSASLSAIHIWIRPRKPKPELCERCKIQKPYDLANISGEYKRNINDFKWLCRRCHMEEDGRKERLIQKSKSRTRLGINGTLFCPKCKEFKPKENFRLNKCSIHGRDSYCKECSRQRYFDKLKKLNKKKSQKQNVKV